MSSRVIVAIFAVVSAAALVVSIILYVPLDFWPPQASADKTVAEEKVADDAEKASEEDIEDEEVEPTPSPTPDEVEEEEDVDESTADELDAYLTSAERADRFSSLLESAEQLIINGLQSGQFVEPSGEGVVFVSYSQDEQGKNIGGPGNISTTYESQDHFEVKAQVNWNADLSMDFDTPITNLSLFYKTDDGYASVSFAAPGANESGDDYWTSERKIDGVMTLNFHAVSIVEQDGWEGLSDSSDAGTEMPTSLEEFKAFDESVIEHFNAGMTYWFKEAWPPQ